MRLGIDGRFFSDAQTLSRGMGRYSLNQIEALREHRPDVDLVALRRPDGKDALHRAAPGLDSIEIPGALCTPLPAPLTRGARLARDAEYAAWLAGIGLDALLATTPFLSSVEPHPPLPGACPTVVNLFDLIPLVYRRQYLPRGTQGEKEYFGVLERLPLADSFVAISEFVRREFRAYLGIPQRRVEVGYPLPAPVFRPVPAAEAEAALRRLGLARQARGGFVLCVPHSHHSKNIRTLLDAWALLPRDFRKRRTLVLTCDLIAPYAEQLRAWIREAGIEDEVVHTGFVSDTDLAALYTAAWLYVHPSRYEGFGLPVVEANACGTAVVSSWAASLPEAVGAAGLLVDPENAAAFRDALVSLDGDPERLAALRGAAPASAARFRSKDLADAVVAAAEAAVASRRPALRGPRRPRVAIVSPVPPQESGVAEYALEMASALGERAEVELFVEEGVSPGSAACRWPVNDVRRLGERRNAPGFDAVLHQMGASRFHLFVERTARGVPGIVTLHDLAWGGVGHSLASSALDRAAFRKDLERLEGREALREYCRLLERCGDRPGAGLTGFFRRHPMVGDLVNASRGVVVHLPEAASFVTTRYPGVPVRYVPMGVADPLRVGLPARAVTRARFGLPAHGFVVGAFGLADPVKRLDAAIRAVALLRAGEPEVVLAIVGRFVSGAYRSELRALAASLGVGGRVRLLGAPVHGDFEALLASCDVVVNLRHPSPVQMSAVLVRALAAGVPAAVTDLPEWRFLPAEACERIPPGEGEVEALSTFFARLAGDEAGRARSAAAARHWYLENATLGKMADGYLSFARELGDGSWEVG
jgi:glycosyltransferase involved in cell wall biosynthesis